MAIRWASDRIEDQGVIAFVTNGSWIDGNVDSGLRACLAEEFSTIYVLNLRGNQRTQGERSRREGGKVFGQGSRAPVAITLLVRNPKAKHEGCRIHYHDIGDYLSREQKLARLRDAGSIAGITEWQRITPNTQHDWIDQRSQAYQRLHPLGAKDVKAGRGDDAAFQLFSNGYKTGRDAWLYGFSLTALAQRSRQAVAGYMNARRDVRDAVAEQGSAVVDAAASTHSRHIHWDDKLKSKLARHQSVRFSADNIRVVQYRPFVKQHCYADHHFAQRPALTGAMFPPDKANRAICVRSPAETNGTVGWCWPFVLWGERVANGTLIVARRLTGVGSTKPFSALMVDCLPDLELISKGQCFPRYRFHQKEESQPGLPGHGDTLTKVDNVTECTLRTFRKHYNDRSITKSAIFDYIYGVLHAPDFRARFANDLAKELPRIPFAPDFHAFADAGRALARLHVGYETCRRHPLQVASTARNDITRFRLAKRKMRYLDAEKSRLAINDTTQLHGIPPQAHRYEVNGRTPVDWLIDRYHVSQDKQSGIVNDANEWFAKPKDLLAAIERVVHVSVETVRIVSGLPTVGTDVEP